MSNFFQVFSCIGGLYFRIHVKLIFEKYPDMVWDMTLQGSSKDTEKLKKSEDTHVGYMSVSNTNPSLNNIGAG